MINHDGASTLDTLVKSLGLPAGCDFLEKSLPEIIHRKNTLQLLLRSGDCTGAKECAQNSLGSIRFFGSAKLEALLLQIANNQINPDNIVDVQRSVSREFESVIRTIKSWLAVNKLSPSPTDKIYSSSSVEL